MATIHRLPKRHTPGADGRAAAPGSTVIPSAQRKS